uniref:Uncharacterized protein n=1 Tax=Oryza meridionalis TaxID=40149 RepID=A0A0E0F5K5_9ORYZ
MNIMLVRRSETRAEKSGGGGESDGRVWPRWGSFDRGGGCYCTMNKTLLRRSETRAKKRGGGGGSHWRV